MENISENEYHAVEIYKPVLNTQFLKTQLKDNNAILIRQIVIFETEVLDSWCQIIAAVLHINKGQLEVA